MSDFRACVTVSFEPGQALKQLPGANNKDKSTSNSANDLNDICLSILKQHCSAENYKQRKSQGPKVNTWITDNIFLKQK